MEHLHGEGETLVEGVHGRRGPEQGGPGLSALLRRRARGNLRTVTSGISPWCFLGRGGSRGLNRTAQPPAGAAAARLRQGHTQAGLTRPPAVPRCPSSPGFMCDSGRRSRAPLGVSLLNIR